MGSFGQYNRGPSRYGEETLATLGACVSIFDGFGGSDPSTSTLDPKRLFRNLKKPKGSKFTFPHDIQSEVWDKWFARRDEPDLVLKMNTGSGKTVVGLVIAKSSLNEGKGPAVYLVPNNQLQSQVAETAKALGIAWTEDLRDPAFRQGEAVLICSVQTVYNGRSRFGLEGSGKYLEVGTVVIDDAHACIPAIEAQFSLTLSSNVPAFKLLLEKFGDVLKAQSLAGWSAIRKGEVSHAVPVPYWAWLQELEESFEIISKTTDKESDGFSMRWPLIRNHISLCDVAFTGREVEIRLPYPDLSMVPSFTRALRRVYMTATLADDGVLIRQMGVESSCVTNPVAPDSASDLGDRIILTPVETSRRIDAEDVRRSARRWGRHHNVVVITPSTYRAEAWRPYTSEIHLKDTVKDAVKRLKRGFVGLVVLVARYDGVDLPDDACRVLIIDGLPERYSPQERVEAAAIGDVDSMSVQQVQRIEQGMGRGVRAVDDFCAVILLDSRLVERLYTADGRRMLSPGTRAQYELSMRFANGGRNQKMGFFESAVEAFLERDAKWTNESRKAVEGLTYERLATVDPLLEAERDAFRLAREENFLGAARALEGQFRAVKDPRQRAWVKQRAASYLHRVEPAEARKIQDSARIDSKYVLKVPSIPTPKLKGLSDQAQAATAYLSRYASVTDLEVAVDALLQDLTPSTSKGSHKRFEAALDQLGHLLGFNASRPDAEDGIGPDNMWAIGRNRYWVIECKSESVAKEVSRDYLEQLSHSADWFESQYDQTASTYLPLMIHPSRTPFWDAVPRKGARVMPFDRLEALRAAVRSFVTAILVDDGYKRSATVGENLRHFGLASQEIQQRWTQEFKSPAKKE